MDPRWLEAGLGALFGLLIGSFLNVCIYRLPLDLSVVRPRSFCPGCERQIAWYDNVPLLTFALLRGKCRHCGYAIPWRYPVVEFLTAALFISAVLRLGPTGDAAKFCVFAALLIALIFSDLEQRILPDEFTIGGTLAGVAFAAFVPLKWGFVSLVFYSVRNQRLISVGEALFAAGFCAGAVWLVGWLYEKLRHREGLGFGDVKMIAMIGAFLGLEGALLAMIVGSVLGSVTGVAYIYFAGKDARNYELPFGSFLGAAALLVATLGQLALEWYARMGAL